MSSHRPIRRVLAAIAMAAALLGVAAPAAAAVSTVDSTSTSSVTSEASTSTETALITPASIASALPTRIDDPSGYVDLAKVYGEYLPTNRWQVGSASFHGRFDQFLQNDLIAYSQRNITQGVGMMTGNGIYVATQGLLSFGLDLQPMNELGATADQTAATIGSALMDNSPVVVAILVLIIGAAVFQMARTGARPWKKLGTTVMVVSLFAIMLAGAQGSTISDAGKFEPGLGSPGWFATTINNSISNLATVPAQALSVVSPVGSMNMPEGTGCYAYLANMNDAYTLGYGIDSGNSGIVPQIVSSLWSSTGLTVWKQTQYGETPYDETSGATYGDNVFCHQLDWQSNIPAAAQAKMTFGSEANANQAGFVASSAAWGGTDNDKIDQSLVAWAACVNDGNGNFTVRDGFKNDKSGNAWIGEADCRSWWTSSAESASMDKFNVTGKASDVYDKTDDPAVISFLTTLHGNDTNGGLLLIWTYVASAIGVFIVFGMLGIAITIAKFAGIVMAVTVFFVLIMSLLARQDMGGKVMQFLRTYLGYAVFAFGATFILAMVTILSKMVSDTGMKTFGPGSIMALIFTGLSPLIAVWLLHMVFTKIFKVPGVFKPSSAFAWGAAGGAVGGAFGSGLTSRMEGRGSSMMRRAGRTAASRASEYAMGGAMLNRSSRRGAKNTRQGMMAPVAGGAAGALAGASAASAIAGGKVNKNQIRATKFDKGELREARRFRDGIDPNASRAEEFAQRAGKAVKRGRERMAGLTASGKSVTSSEGRTELGQRGTAALGSMRTNLTSAASQARNVGKWFYENPSQASAYMAERAVAGGRRAATTAGRGMAEAGRRLQPVAGDPAAGAAARVTAGLAVGTVLGGPVGAVVGGAIGLARAHHGVNVADTKANAKMIADYAAHKDAEKVKAAAEQKAARKASQVRVDDKS